MTFQSMKTLLGVSALLLTGCAGLKGDAETTTGGGQSGSGAGDGSSVAVSNSPYPALCANNTIDIPVTNLYPGEGEPRFTAAISEFSSASVSLHNVPAGVSSWLTWHSGNSQFEGVVPNSVAGDIEQFVLLVEENGACGVADIRVYYQTLPTCVWNGSQDDDLGDLANYSQCMVLGDSLITVPSSAAQQPVHHSGTIFVRGFAKTHADDGGGTITIRNGAKFKFAVQTLSDHVGSSIGFVGETANRSLCNCEVESSGNIEVVNGATLTLGKGISVKMTNGAELRIGRSGAETGHLVTEGGSSVAEFPSIGGTGTGFETVSVSGKSTSDLSTTDIDGLVVQDHAPNLGNASFRYTGNFFVQELRNFRYLGANVSVERGISFDCTHNLGDPNKIATQSLSGLVFSFEDGSTDATNIDNRCGSIPALSLDATCSMGGIVGPCDGYENDPNNVLNWI